MSRHFDSCRKTKIHFDRFVNKTNQFFGLDFVQCFYFYTIDSLLLCNTGIVLFKAQVNEPIIAGALPKKAETWKMHYLCEYLSVLPK